jgi:hypothetical protein
LGVGIIPFPFAETALNATQFLQFNGD